MSDEKTSGKLGRGVGDGEVKAVKKKSKRKETASSASGKLGRGDKVKISKAEQAARDARKMCLECKGGYEPHIRDCKRTDCRHWPLRMGRPLE